MVAFMPATMAESRAGAPPMLRHKLSTMRQRWTEREADPALAVRGYAVTHPPGTIVLPTAPGWNQLLYASRGVMTVESHAGTWVIPPHRALWVPAGADHRIVMHGRVSVRTLYMSDQLHALPQAWLAVSVPPLLRELILHTVLICPLDLRRPEHERLIGVLLDQLTALPHTSLQLPMPADPTAIAFAQVLIDDQTVTVVDAARRVGVSRRTLERRFATEAGMSIGRWRQRQRLVRALELLAAGEPVTAVAIAVGYSTPSAFGVMFREHLGEPPGTYFTRDGTR